MPPLFLGSVIVLANRRMAKAHTATHMTTNWLVQFRNSTTHATGLAQLGEHDANQSGVFSLQTNYHLQVLLSQIQRFKVATWVLEWAAEKVKKVLSDEIVEFPHFLALNDDILRVACSWRKRQSIVDNYIPNAVCKNKLYMSWACPTLRFALKKCQRS